MNKKDEEKEISEDLPEESEELIEFEYNEDGEEDLKKTLKKLRADLKQCKKEKEEYLTGWQKERADFANYKKGEEDRRANYSEVIRERILSKFLPVLDSFNMAFANREVWEKVDEKWRIGVEYIYNQIVGVFEEYEVHEIGMVGEKFNPSIHEPVEMVETYEEEKDHTVSLVIQKGYKLGERVIRPARVNLFEHKKE